MPVTTLAQASVEPVFAQSSPHSVTTTTTLAVVALAVAFNNVDTLVLASCPSVSSALAIAIQNAVASEVGSGVSPSDVTVQFVGDPVITHVSFIPAAGTLSSSSQTALASSATLGDAIARNVANVEDIDTIANGPIIVGDISAQPSLYSETTTSTLAVVALSVALNNVDPALLASKPSVGSALDPIQSRVCSVRCLLCH